MTGRWITPDGGVAVIEYDQANRVVVSGELMRLLLVAAGCEREADRL